MANTPGHYEVLGLKKTCTPDEIIKAYEELILAHSTDKDVQDKEAEEKTKAIKMAYEILSNLEKRRAYDASISKLRPNAPVFEPGTFKSLPQNAQITPRPYLPYYHYPTGSYPQPNPYNFPPSGPFRVPQSFDYQVYQPTNNPQNNPF